MPWTFAHPAAVLPLRPLCNHRLSFGTLIVGSIIPDLGYYLGCFPLATMAHTLRGLVIICLPTGLGLLALIRVLHKPVAGLLPLPYRQALLTLPQFQKVTTPTPLWYASIGIIIGATTHIAWDSFTHIAGYFVLRWPVLRTPVFEIDSRTFRLFELLQHASTALGVFILVLACLRWRRRVDLGTSPPITIDEKLRYILLATITVTSLVVGLPLAYFASTSNSGETNLMLFIVRYVICCTTVFVISLCATSLVVARRFSSMQNELPKSGRS
jgi:hypothetical protein